MRGARSWAEAPLYRHQVALANVCVIFFPIQSFSREIRLIECVYGSLTLRLFSHIDSFHPFSCCLSTHNPNSERPCLSTRIAPGDHEQASFLSTLAKMHHFTPMYSLFSPPLTASLIAQTIVHPSSVSHSYHQNRHPRNHRHPRPQNSCE